MRRRAEPSAATAAWREVNSSDPDVWTDHFLDQSAARLFIGITPDPSEYPRAVLLREPPALPRPWPIGRVSRRSGNLVDSGNSSNLGAFHYVYIPVEAGLNVSTHAGPFTNCLRILSVQYINVPSLGVVDWGYEYHWYAPGVGPVYLWDCWQEGGQPSWWHVGSLVGAYVNGTWYGSHF